MKVKCQIGIEQREELTAGQLADFFATIPDAARDSIPIRIMGDKGSQWDPWPTLRGIRVEWEEER